MERRIKVRCIKPNPDLKVKKGCIYDMKYVSALDEFKIFEYIDCTDRYNRLANLDRYIKDGYFEVVESA